MGASRERAGPSPNMTSCNERPTDLVRFPETNHHTSAHPTPSTAPPHLQEHAHLVPIWNTPSCGPRANVPRGSPAIEPCSVPPHPSPTGNIATIGVLGRTKSLSSITSESGLSGSLPGNGVCGLICRVAAGERGERGSGIDPSPRQWHLRDDRSARPAPGEAKGEERDRGGRVTQHDVAARTAPRSTDGIGTHHSNDQEGSKVDGGSIGY